MVPARCFEEKKKKYVSKRNFQAARPIWLKASSIERGDRGNEFGINCSFLKIDFAVVELFEVEEHARGSSIAGFVGKERWIGKGHSSRTAGPIPLIPDPKERGDTGVYFR